VVAVIPSAKLDVISWGPDPQCPLYANGDASEHLIVSSGKSNRDLQTLVDAMGRVGDSGLIYDVGATVPAAPPNVDLVLPGGHGTDPASLSGFLPSRVYEDLRRASVIAIPIRDPNRLTGLTEINDALALGMPLILTRSPYTPVDVEAIGCGFVVEPGDVDGWVRALVELRDPATRRQMGDAGGTRAKKSWNYGIFCDQLDASLRG
jgi:glycosyltransferase involved in cell wall biosynthesis